MAMTTLNTRFQFKRDSLEALEMINPIPLAGEPCVAFSDSGIIFKIGDGVRDWKNLPVVFQENASRNQKHFTYKTLNPTYELL